MSTFAISSKKLYYNHNPQSQNGLGLDVNLAKTRTSMRRSLKSTVKRTTKSVCYAFLEKTVVDVWNLHLHGNDRSLHLHINSCTANQELMLLENHWTTVSRAEEWKTCKRIKAYRNWPRLGAGQRGSDAFVSIDSQKNLESEFLYWKSTVHT